MATNYWGEELATFLLNGIELASGLKIAEVFSNPSAGAGYSAPIGSFAIHNSVWYKKTSGTDTGWTVVPDQDAIDSLTTLINDHITDTTDAHDATAISSTNTLGANVELVLTALKNYKDLGLQSAYNEYSDITVDAVNPIKIKNIAGDTQTYPLQVRSNDEGDIYFAAGKDNTFMKNVTFSSDPTKKIELTTNGNIKTTDSLGTNLFRKDFNELYVEDFKENLPSAVLTASNAAITVNDATNANYLSNTITTFTQSSALTGYYVESDAIAITNNNKWLLEPIKIQSMQGTSGGAGTWDFRIFTSTDGVSYADKKVAVQLGDLKNDKIITQLDSDVTHVKLRWTIVNPDNATTLTLGGFIITSDAFPVGQTTLFGTLKLSAFTTESTFIDGTISNDGILKSQSTAAGMEFYSDVDCTANIAGTVTVPSNNNYSVLTIYENGVATSYSSTISNPSPNVNLQYSHSLNFKITKGKTYKVFASPSVNSGANVLTISATGYADNVIVDAATFSSTQTQVLASNVLNAQMFEFDVEEGVEYLVTGQVSRATSNSQLASIMFSSLANGTGEVFSYHYMNLGTGTWSYNKVDGVAFKFTATSSKKLYVHAFGNNNVLGDGTKQNTYIQISKAPPAFVQLDVSNERENVYSARIANNGTATITSQSYPFIQSVSRVIAGEVLITFKAGFFSATPAATLVTEQNTNVDHHRIKSISTTSMSVVTQDSSLASADLNFSFVLQRQGADYREPTAFIANAVSLTNHVIGGQEYWTGEKVGNKKVYARMWQVTSDKTATYVVANIGTGLIGLNGTQLGVTFATSESYMYISSQYVQKVYNKSTGDFSVNISGLTQSAGDLIFFKYIYP